MDSVDHLSVFLSDAETANSAFAGIVIHKDVSIFQKYSSINELSKAEKLGNYQEELSIYAGDDLLVVDDFRLMSMGVNKCRNLFEVFDSRDPHKSILVISQFPVFSWYDMFQEHTYAEACLARLLSGAYRLKTREYRTYKQAING